MADVRPIHAAHSIQELTLALEFQSAITQEAFQRLYDRRADFADQLPGEQLTRGYSLPMIQGMPLQGFPMIPGLGAAAGQMPISAVQFIRVQPNGMPEIRLTAQANSIAFTCMAYTRWAEVWQIGRDLMKRAIPVILESPITTFGMSYIDKFLITGDVDTFRATDLFRDDGNHLSRAVLDKPLFHVHQGYFTFLPNGTRTLVNVNVDVQDETAGRVVVVTTYLRALADSDGVNAERLFSDDEDGIADATFSQLHDHAKVVLADLLNDEMVERINLGAP